MTSDETLDLEARAWLDAADRDYTPSASDRARVRANLSRAIAPGLAATAHRVDEGTVERLSEGAASTSGAAAGVTWGTKALLGAVFVGSVGFGSGYWTGQRDSVSARAPGVHQRLDAAPGELPREAPSREQASAPHGPAIAAQPTAAREPAGTRAAHAPPGVDVTEPAAQAELEVKTPALWQEAQLLRRAQLALRQGNGQLASALLDQLAEEFPNGTLVEERAAARVLADCALGRVERAKSRAAQFLASYPASVHAARVRGSCGAAAPAKSGGD